MANKHVTNPCGNSGMAVREEDLEKAALNHKGILKGHCWLCNQSKVTINKKTGLYRKHPTPSTNNERS